LFHIFLIIIVFSTHFLKFLPISGNINKNRKSENRRTVTGWLQPTTSTCWPSSAVEAARVPAPVRAQSTVTTSGSRLRRRGDKLAGSAVVVLRRQGFPPKLKVVMGVAPGKERHLEAHRNGG
jgi:hypothetical protein